MVKRADDSTKNLYSQLQLLPHPILSSFLLSRGNHLLFLELLQHSYLQFLTNMLISLIFLDLSTLGPIYY